MENQSKLLVLLPPPAAPHLLPAACRPLNWFNRAQPKTKRVRGVRFWVMTVLKRRRRKRRMIVIIVMMVM